MKLPVLFALSALLFSCSQSDQTPSKPSALDEGGTSNEQTATDTVADDRTSLDAPIPDQAMAKKHSVSWEKIALGHAIYMRKCGECHEHLLPDEIDSQDWKDHVTAMSLKSGISPEEETALREYLVTAAKESEEKP